MPADAKDTAEAGVPPASGETRPLVDAEAAAPRAEPALHCMNERPRPVGPRSFRKAAGKLPLLLCFWGGANQV
eukprot:COSAG04_NODE_2837_length_3504_cov_7.068409_4_plen_72_part_01